MSFSVFQVECHECSNQFQGYVKGSPSAGVQYSCPCPKCGKEINLPRDRATWMESHIPDGAVKLESN